MYREILYRDITLATHSILHPDRIESRGMTIIAKVKRRRKRRLIEYGIKNFMCQISA